LFVTWPIEIEARADGGIAINTVSTLPASTVLFCIYTVEDSPHNIASENFSTKSIFLHAILSVLLLAPDFFASYFASYLLLNVFTISMLRQCCTA